MALCLPVGQCAMNRRTALTELGPDTEALREQDRSAILFDLGLDALQIDAAVRIADPAIVARLREHTGRSLFEPENPAMGFILDANPHRVFIARIGRVEVFQPIPPPDGESPQGPHTHVLAKLLKLKRTHAATELIPKGWVPAGYLYPANPLKDADGRDRPFDRAHHEAFQAIMRAFGDPGWMGLKDRVAAAVAAGPGSIRTPGAEPLRTPVRARGVEPDRSLRRAGALASGLGCDLWQHAPWSGSIALDAVAPTAQNAEDSVNGVHDASFTRETP